MRRTFTFYFRNNSTTGDGILAALSLLEVCLDQGKSIHELKQEPQKLPQQILNVDVRQSTLRRAQQIFGLHAEDAKRLGKDGRLLLRYSGTENKFRIWACCSPSQVSKLRVK